MNEPASFIKSYLKEVNQTELCQLTRRQKAWLGFRLIFKGKILNLMAMVGSLQLSQAQMETLLEFIDSLLQPPPSGRQIEKTWR